MPLLGNNLNEHRNFLSIRRLNSQKAPSLSLNIILMAIIEDDRFEFERKISYAIL